MGKRPEVGAFVSYEQVPAGFEAIYTGETDLSQPDVPELGLRYSVDAEGNVTRQYSLWGFGRAREDQWDDEIQAINAMQVDLGPLSDPIRRIRQHIGSLVGCDNGVPVTIDEVLNAIGTGSLPALPLHAGCWMPSGPERTTQPLQHESMAAIETVLRGYLDGVPQDEAIAIYPYAAGFIDRTYAWLGPIDDLTALQRLMLSRVLLPFEYFAGHNPDPCEVLRTCFDEGEKGKALDAEISALAQIPAIYPNYREEYREALASIEDPEKAVIYTICGHIADCVSELSDCHHATFRRIERWIHGIGTLTWEMESRKPHVESQRLGRLLFGYAQALDRWLQDVPMQFLLLDMGHVDLGFDPKNEILRVYAYLGEPTPVKRWLAACLWYKCVLEPPACLYRSSWNHKDLLARAEDAGVSIRTWMDGVLAASRTPSLGSGAGDAGS